MPSNHSTSIPNKENEPDAITPTISTDIIEKELTTDKTILNILKVTTKKMLYLCSVKMLSIQGSN